MALSQMRLNSISLSLAYLIQRELIHDLDWSEVPVAVRPKSVTCRHFHCLIATAKVVD